MSDKYKDELLADWLRHAKNDITSARILFENSRPRQTEIAAYLSRQCAEKSLKAFLFFNDIDPPKIHDLEKLCVLCKNIDSSFSNIGIECKKLNPYGAVTRYPNELVIDDVVAKNVIERAQIIYDFCIAKVNAL